MSLLLIKTIASSYVLKCGECFIYYALFLIYLLVCNYVSLIWYHLVHVCITSSLLLVAQEQ